MDFQQLLAKMQELDTPVQECGDMPPSPMSSPMTPPTTPPSMSVNLNAQGMDNIEDLLKLITKVNPDATKDAGLPSLGAMPSLTPPGPSISGLGNLDAGPLKMLPDLDNEEPANEPKAIDVKIDGGDMDDKGPEMMDKPDDSDDGVSKAQGDLDNDGDHDMDDHDMEEPEKEKEEEFANEPDTDTKSVDYMNNQLAGGMNKPKSMHKHSYKQGDNPMAMEGEELRSYIKSELQRRLNEAKGAK